MHNYRSQGESASRTIQTLDARNANLLREIDDDASQRIALEAVIEDLKMQLAGHSNTQAEADALKSRVAELLQVII